MNFKIDGFNEWQNEELNTAEALYYAEVTARIYKKLEMWD